MLPKQLKKVQRLKQHEAMWFATRRRAYTWIHPKGEHPYRPDIVLVMETEQGKIRRTDIGDSFTPEAVLASLLNAMRRPILGSGGRYRPTRIVLDDPALVEALSSPLAQLEIRCVYQPTPSLVDDTMHSMAIHMNRQEPIPGLLSVPGATVPLIGELFTAAADFYRQEPWEWLDNQSPIEVRYPAEGRARYALVLGSGGDAFGLALYESLDDIHTVYSAIDPEEATERVPWFSLVFEEPMAMSFYDLDAIEKYQWPVADESAYPVTIKTVPGGSEFMIPNAAELAWLAAALRTIPDFILHHLCATQRFPRPADATLPLSGVHGGQQIALRYRGDLWELQEGVFTWEELADDETNETNEADEAQAELEDFIEDWYWDAASHEFARQVGQFLFAFLDDMDTEDLSDRTYNKHVDNCWLIGKFTCDYGYYEAFSPKIFRGEPSYLIEFKRKVSEAPSAIKSYKTTWRKLARYVQRLE